jgi:hypothetical protein
MDWISQNWLSIALGAGAVFFLSRMGGCGMSHSGGHHRDNARSVAPPPAPGAPGSGNAEGGQEQRRPHRHGCC